MNIVVSPAIGFTNPCYVLTNGRADLVGNKAKGKSQKGCFKKTKYAKFSEKRTFLNPDMHKLFLQIN